MGEGEIIEEKYRGLGGRRDYTYLDTWNGFEPELEA